MSLPRMRRLLQGPIVALLVGVNVAALPLYGEEPGAVSLFDVPLLDDAGPPDDLVVENSSPAALPDAVDTLSPLPAGTTPIGFVPASPDAITSDELLRRLEETEAQLANLQAQQNMRNSEPSMMTALQDRWQQVRDPSIITVDQQTRKTSSGKSEKESKKWFDRLSVRGYAQFRFNTTLTENENLAPAQHVGDRSIGNNQSFLIRRARVIISGDVSDHMYVYLQPDFASSVPGSPDANQFAQIRDWYADLYIDKTKVHRVRIGQSKIPFGWENLQSSSNRIPLDRNDGLNSAVRNERDLGVIYYWTPEDAQDLFKYVLDEGLKGSGNYGVFGLGVYNGQGGSLSEQNDDVHVVARIAYPFRLPSNQIVEFGLQGYTGRYVVLSSLIQPLGVGPAARPLGTLETGSRGIRDERIGGTFVVSAAPRLSGGMELRQRPGAERCPDGGGRAASHRGLRDGHVSPPDQESGSAVSVRPVELLRGWLQGGTECPVQPHQRVRDRPRVAVQPADGARDAVHHHRPHEHQRHCDRRVLPAVRRPTAADAVSGQLLTALCGVLRSVIPERSGWTSNTS